MGWELIGDEPTSEGEHTFAGHATRQCSACSNWIRADVADDDCQVCDFLAGQRPVPTERL